MARLPGLLEVLQSVVRCWLPVSQEPSGGTDKPGHRTKREGRPSVQKIRHRILSGDRKQADSGDAGYGLCRMRQRAGRDLQGHFRLPLCRGAGQHDSNSQRR